MDPSELWQQAMREQARQDLHNNNNNEEEDEYDNVDILQSLPTAFGAPTTANNHNANHPHPFPPSSLAGPSHQSGVFFASPYESLVPDVGLVDPLQPPSSNYDGQGGKDEGGSGGDDGDVREVPPAGRRSFLVRGDNGATRWIAAGATLKSKSKAERRPPKKTRLETADPATDSLYLTLSSSSSSEGDVEEEGREGQEEEEGPERTLYRPRRLLPTPIAALIAEGKQRLSDMEAELLFAVPEAAVPLLGTPPPAPLPRHPSSAAAAALPAGASLPAGHTKVGGELWVTKYQPRTFREALSDETINLKLLQWLRSWDSYVFGGSHDHAGSHEGKRERPEERLAVLVGPPGVGKTTLVHVLAAHCGYEAIEINASVERTASRLETLIKSIVSTTGGSAARRPATTTTTTSSSSSSNQVGPSLVDHLRRPKCLIIDEIDGIASNVAQFLLQQDIHRPVFCLCNDFYVPSLRPLRQHCTLVCHLPPIHAQHLLTRLQEIVAREGMAVDQTVLAELIQSADGDIRSCLNTLQFLHGAPEATRPTHPATAGGGGGAEQLLEQVLERQAKDGRLSAWDTWGLLFHRLDRSRVLQKLKKECGIDYEALLSASAAATQRARILADRRARERERAIGRPSLPPPPPAEADATVPIGFHVDPTYLYVAQVLAGGAEREGMLDGLQENYLGRGYSDYTFARTRDVAASFSWQDCLSAVAYRHAPALVPFAEQYQLVTALRCHMHCATAARGERLSYPQEGARLRQALGQAQHVAHSFREGCRGAVAAHLWSEESVSGTVAPLLLRCLFDVTLRLPTHAIGAVTALPPAEQQKVRAAVARHAAYGLTYRKQPAREAAAEGAAGEEVRWALEPPLQQLGGIHRPSEEQQRYHRAAGGGYVPAWRRQQQPQQGGGGGRSYNNTTTSSSVVGEGGAGGGGAKRPRGAAIYQPREELKQMLVAEIQQFLIRERAAHFHAATDHHHNKNQNEKNTKQPLATPTTTAATIVSAAAPPAAVSSHPHPLPNDTPTGTPAVPAPTAPAAAVAAPAAAVKRDFFGRVITTTSTTNRSSAASAAGANARKPSTTSPTPTSSRHQHAHNGGGGSAVRYVYQDGATNAVKIPAVLSDF